MAKPVLLPLPSFCQHLPLPSQTPNAPHKLKLSIWWDEADAAFRVKLAESHTLVEGAVINGN